MIRVPILMYHSIDDSPEGACVRPKRFDEQLACLSKSGYRAVDLDAVYDCLAKGAPLPSKPVVITFDDGYRDNLENAYPVLKKHGMCATIFLPTDYVDGTNRWNEAEGAQKRSLLSWTEVRALAGDPLISFQAHTCTHPKLTQVPLDRVRDELKRSKETIEDRLGRPCDHLAYPYGDFDIRVRDTAEGCGFHTASSTRWGHNRPGGDLFSLYRIGVRNQDGITDFKRAIGGQPSSLKYYWLRLKARFN